MIRIALVVIVVAAVGGGVCVYRGVSASVHAEYVLHAALLTLELLDEYVAQHDGEWPRTWADLEQLPPKQNMFEWPTDSREVQKYVTVDFAADPKRLAQQTPAEFDAVRPIGPYYPFEDRWQMKALIKTIREHQPAEGGRGERNELPKSL
jgi:hypothetical protein